MKVKKAVFVSGIVEEDERLRDGKPQVVFIGRSNVGKSSMINTLAGKPIARSSNTPGKTREINLYLINKDLYFVDLPGYGFAKGSQTERSELKNLIYSYLFFSDIPHRKIVIIIDAEVGVTDSDKYFIRRLEESKKDFIVVANKIDKIKKSELKTKLDKVQAAVGDHKVMPCSTKNKIGIGELWAEISR